MFDSVKLPRSWQFAALGVGAIIFLVWAWITGWQPPIRAVDLNQHRVDTALPIARGTQTNQQTFIAGKNGLTDIELLLVHYSNDDPLATGTEQTFTATLLGADGVEIAGNSWDTSDFTHNQTLLFRFPVQRKSAGISYTLQLAGNEHNNATVWGYQLPVIADGTLTLAEPLDPAPQAMRLITRYELGWSSAGAYLIETMWSEGWYLLVAMGVLLLPGAMFFSLMPAFPQTKTIPISVKLAIATAIGASTWAILWLWLDLVGFTWQPWLLWLLVAGGWSLVIFRYAKTQRRKGAKISPSPRPPLSPSSYLLILILTLTLAVRFLAIRDLAFPPWVDSSRHGLITAVMAENGHTLTNYAPFLDVDRSLYHTGFHAYSATLAMMTDVPIHRLLLNMGQLLQTLMPLTVYGGAWLLTRRRGVGLIAAFLVAMPFFFPAYYATWGRFTQLTAMLIMPILIGLVWQLVRGAKMGRRWWWVVGLLSAGIFLIHIRVFLIYLPFVLLVWLFSMGRHTRWLAMAGALGGLLVLPRALQLQATQLGGGILNAPASYNSFPMGYIETGWEEFWLILGGIGLLVALIASFWRRRWTTLPLLLAAWVVVVGGVLSGRISFIPTTWLININSAYITLFLPLSLLLGVVIARLWQVSRRAHWIVATLSLTLGGAGLMAMLLFGARQQITILNESTILAWEADNAGITYINNHLPTNANIAVSSWLWSGTTWAVSDGGAWLVPLTQRTATTPPADYIYADNNGQTVRRFNEAATAITDWSDPTATAWLQEQGVTHIYVGAKGGYFDPAKLAQNPQTTIIYIEGGVFVFALINGENDE